MKKFTSFIILVSVIISALFLPLNAEAAGITDINTVTEYAEIIYSRRFGANYKNSPTPPVFYQGSLYLVSGKMLYKLNAANGVIEVETELSSDSIYTTIPVLCENGKVFIPLDGGIVEVHSANTLELLWIYKNPLGGQAITPVVCEEGVVYTGFWNGEEGVAEFAAIPENPAGKENKALWTYQNKGGFYWAQCKVTEKHILVGLDDGEYYSENPSAVAAINKETGEEVSRLPLTGDIRSGITEYNGFYYVAGKAGFICKFSFDEETEKFSSPVFFFPAGSVTSTPVIYKGRMYFGSSAYPDNYIYVVDADTMKEIYKVSVPGYPQAEMLLSTAYEQTEGKIYVYSAYNAKPGGILILEDAPGQTEPLLRELIAPSGEFAEYCISPISVGDDGTLYYKNDSGCIFAAGELTPFRSVFIDITRLMEKLMNIIKNLLENFLVNSFS